MPTDTPTTSLCHHNLTGVAYRDKDLVSELLGENVDFTRVMSGHILGRDISDTELKVINAALVVLMEHGLTPSAISSRLVYMSAPENLQGAVAAGLLAVGSSFVGTMENCAELLEQLVIYESDTERTEKARAIVTAYREAKQPLPGFGHHLHKPDDPRATELLRLADQWKLNSGHVQALRVLSTVVDEELGKHLTINATGAIAALFGEIDIPVQVMRGFAVISRAAGLVAHVAEEQQVPSGRYIWELVDRSIPYKGD